MKMQQRRKSNMRSRGFVLPLPAILLLMLSLVFYGEFPEAAASWTSGSNVSALYILGDSSVDCGDNTLFYPFLHGRSSLYPCNNGSDATLPQLLAEKMGLPFIQPFYHQNGSLQQVLGGLNFGSAQATIMTHGIQSYQSLNQQLRQVFETLQLLQLQVNMETALQFTKSSIFYLSFGKEDYIDLFLTNSSQMFKHSAHDIATIFVNQMIHGIRYLYDANVRKVICMGIIPLGCTPCIARELNQTSSEDDHGKDCVDEVNKLVLEYNRVLDDYIAKLNQDFPDAQVVFCDVYEGMMEIINKPKLYGFEDTKTACCGLGLNGAMIGCISKDIACDQASNHIWWDLFNPTQAVHCILAKAAWSGQHFPGLCRPITVQELVNKRP